jgi:hypothetical protein
MTTYAIGSDKINGNEEAYINQAIQKARDTGNEAVSVGVNPNVVQQHGLSTDSDGQIGIMIVGGRGLGTPMDFHTGVTNGYYHYSHVYVIGSSEFTGNNLISSSSMNTPVNRCEPGMSTSQCNKYKGLTPAQFNEKYTGCTVIYCDNFSDGLQQIFGETDNEESTDSGTSFKDMIKDLVKVWDGLVEINLDGGVMNIRHIPDPEDPEPVSTKSIRVDKTTGKTIANRKDYYKVNIRQEPCLWAMEGINIVADSLTVTDWNTETTNHLIVHYTSTDGVSHSISFTDDVLINRFGERVVEKDAVTYEHIEENSEQTGAVEVPITDYNDAVSYGLGEWFRIQRDNGFKLECKVLGGNEWRAGRWCKINIPLLGTYVNTYITRANHSYDGEWLTSIECLSAPACIKEDDSTTDSNSTTEDTT